MFLQAIIGHFLVLLSVVKRRDKSIISWDNATPKLQTEIPCSELLAGRYSSILFYKSISST